MRPCGRAKLVTKVQYDAKDRNQDQKDPVNAGLTKDSSSPIGRIVGRIGRMVGFYFQRRDLIDNLALCVRGIPL